MESTTDKHFENELDASFWNRCWQSGQTGWDIGHASPPIVRFLESYPDKEAAVLIPGCGNAYEAEWMADNGFTNITLLDIAEAAVARLKEKFRDRPQAKIINGDFFQHTGQYDLIMEQTFFCAQVLERRVEYVKKMASLLKKEGALVGVLFGKKFEMPGPPFGGEADEYTALFTPYFHVKKMEPCYNSIPPRAGAELFIHLIRR